MINLYEKNCTDFNNNGIGSLKDMTKCEITEELNGKMTADIEYPKGCKYSDIIDNDLIIKCDAGSEERQLFRIKNYKENLTKITAKPQHITYDLIDNSLDDVFPQNLTGAAALEWILNRTQFPHSFLSYSNITKVASARYIRKNPVQAIIGDLDNSFVNIWGGELERDNFTIKMLSQRGEDKGYKIKYRKNLTGVEFSKDDSNVITRLRPMGYDGLMLPEKYIDSPYIENYPHPKIGEIEYSDIKLREDPNSEEGYDTLEECYEELRRRANIEFEENNIDKPSVNIKVNFVDLSKTVEYEKYKFLNDVHMGDTVTVILDNIQIKLRVIKTVYDSLLHRFTKLELGKFKANYITDTTKNIQKTVKEETKDLQSTILGQAQEDATNKIVNALGGYIYKTRTDLYIMNAERPEDATKLWRWNINGWGYSNNGVNGPYEMAATMDGSIVANMIKTGVLSADRIHGGTLTLGGNNNYSGVLSLQNELAQELIRMDSRGIILSNGAKLIGGNGVLSNFQFIGASTDKEFVGFMVDDTGSGYKKSKLVFEVYIPANFVIQQANVILEHAPIKWSSGITGESWYGYSRYLHLYKQIEKNYIREATVHSGYVDLISDNTLLDVTNAFGSNGFTANAASDYSHNIQQVVSADIKNYIGVGTTTFVVETAENAPTFIQDFINKPGFERTGQIKGFLNILGYMQ